MTATASYNVEMSYFIVWQSSHKHTKSMLYSDAAERFTARRSYA